MGRERRFKGTDAEVALARFLCEITKSLGLGTVKKVAERFPQGGSRATWAEYLNGSKLIPQPLLGELVQELRRTRPHSWSGNVIVKANRLWKAAAEDAPAPPDGNSAELVALYRRIDETTQALHKAQAVATSSEHVIRMLLQYAGRQESKVELLTDQVGRLREKERSETEHRLEQARLRHARIQTELERARSDRFTAEQAQAVLLREQQEARREIERLQQTAAGPEQADDEPTFLPDRMPEPETSDEETDQELDERLDCISTNGEQRKAMLSEVLERAGLENAREDDDPQVIPGTVVPPTEKPTPAAAPETARDLSRTSPDNRATSEDDPRKPTVPVFSRWGFVGALQEPTATPPRPSPAADEDGDRNSVGAGSSPPPRKPAVWWVSASAALLVLGATVADQVLPPGVFTFGEHREPRQESPRETPSSDDRSEKRSKKESENDSKSPSPSHSRTSTSTTTPPTPGDTTPPPALSGGTDGGGNDNPQDGDGLFEGGENSGGGDSGGADGATSEGTTDGSTSGDTGGSTPAPSETADSGGLFGGP